MRFSSWYLLLLSVVTSFAADHPGFLIDTTTCTQAQSVQIGKALLAAKQIAQAALDAIDDRAQSRLFEFFFRKYDRATVKKVFTQYQTWVTLQGQESVQYFCKDLWNLCKADGYVAYFLFDDATLAAKQIPKLNRISLCPDFFSSAAAPDPCDKKYLEVLQTNPDGSLNVDQATGVLHEFFHVPFVGGVGVPLIDDIFTTIAEMHVLTDLKKYGYDVNLLPVEKRASFKARFNAYSYSAFATWAWIQSKQQALCPENYPLWNALDDASAYDRVELRRLLGEPDSDGDIVGYLNRRQGVAQCQTGCLANATLPPSASYQAASQGDAQYTLITGDSQPLIPSYFWPDNATSVLLPYNATLVNSTNSTDDSSDDGPINDTSLADLYAALEGSHPSSTNGG